MAKILICPDIHGRAFWHKAVELIDDVDHVVFLGDYLDPYGYEGISFDTAVEEFNKILQFKETFNDKVTLLIGNHDCHYVDLDFMDCSRLNYRKRKEMHDLFMNHIEKFNLIFDYESKYLFSHAGVYANWLENNDFSFEDLKNFSKFRENWMSSLEDISFYRGGYNLVGSCVWADLRESLKHSVYPNRHHIVGHTQLEEKPYKAENITCVDVRRCFILNTETGEINEA